MRLVAIIMGLAAAVSSICFGQSGDAPRLRNVAVGFTAQYRNRHWTRLVVDIENPGPARTAWVTVEGSGDYSQQVLLFSRQVWLPANAYRRFDFPVRPDTRVVVTNKQLPVHPVFVARLTDGRFRVWDKLEVLGGEVTEDEFFVLIGDRRFASYNFLKQAVIGPGRWPVARAVTSPRNLPARPLEYQGFDMVILGDLTDGQLTPLQLEAIVDWVRAGGYLIVTPGPTLPAEPLASLLPVRYFSRHQVETLPPLVGAYHFGKPLSLTRMVVTDGQVRLGTLERPLAAVRREGLGKVVALAFDAGADTFAAWPGAAKFFQDVLAERPQFLQEAGPLLEHSATLPGLLSGLAGIKVPTRGLLLVYLLAVIGGILALLLGFRFTRVPEWGWAAALVVALAAGAGGIAAALAWKAQPRPCLNEVFVAVTRSGSGMAFIQSALGLFSPSAASYALATRDDTVGLHPGRSSLTPSEQFPVAYEDVLGAPDLRVRANDIRLMFGRALVAAPEAERPSGVPGPGGSPAVSLPQAAVQLTAEGLHLSVTNPTAHPLEDCFVKYNRFVLPVGDLAAGATWERTGIREPAATFTSRLVRSGADELRSRLRRLLFPDASFDLAAAVSFEERRITLRTRGEDQTPGFFGWTDQPEFPISQIHPAVARRAVGLWAVETAPTFTGTRLFLPKGVLSLRFANKSTRASECGEGKFVGTRPTLLLLNFGLPAGCPALQLETATLSLVFRGGAHECQAFAVPANRTVTDEADLRALTPLAGEPTCPIPDPAGCFNPATRSVLVALRITARRTGPERGEGPAQGLNQWQVRECDLQLTGTVR